ncbi:hypothetical protein HBI70_033810 [Parastagonospora nodorum]|nr:hypothetical protein HBH51_073150 [Parastagonospora nodorum]KAH4069368.1 hypothetical protein HBH50_112290 [Parastagonospora nodorum]KAH4088438.1 hypothetical protein HBH48_129260 [Parastagonospora nodorum]KAH4103625.1 hypothetical protein HBH46_109420 [Parastagonospora nodorum]KAH4132613.1 hypothetical protein HBH47_012430 [Parastagonospora nodorum]
MDALRFGIQTGEVVLHQLLNLAHHERRSIVGQGPYIDIYLGDIRVYKRTSRPLLFASCPDIGRFLSPIQCSFAVCLLDGFTNALTVKLAVLYMEQYLLSPRVRDVPWKGMRERPLDVEQIRGTLAREQARRPSRYAETLANNIFTFTCVAKIELFMLEYEVEPAKSYEDRVKGGIQRRAATISKPVGQAQGRARRQMKQVEDMLADTANLALKQLVWTGNVLPVTLPSQPAAWLEIGLVGARSTAYGHSGSRKILLKRASDLDL